MDSVHLSQDPPPSPLKWTLFFSWVVFHAKFITLCKEPWKKRAEWTRPGPLPPFKWTESIKMFIFIFIEYFPYYFLLVYCFVFFILFLMRTLILFDTEHIIEICLKAFVNMMSLKMDLKCCSKRNFI